MPAFSKSHLSLRLFRLFFGLCLIFGQCNAWGTEGSLPLEIKNYPRKIMFSRHDLREVGKNDHQVKQQEYHETNGLFTGGTISTRTGFGFRSCETLLNRQQGYAIDKMGNTSYLAQEEADFYMNLGSSISPDQVAFFEMLRVVPKGNNLLTELKFRNRTQEYSAPLDEAEQVRTASLWSVAGQRIAPRTLKPENTPLPWQLEEEWAEEVSRLDRSKYKLVWEWGRAAQDVSGDIEPLYRANALSNLKDVIAANGAIDSAYVMFHSLSKINTRLYDRAFPNSRFAEKSEDNVLYLVPLKKVLERYPPSSVSSQIAAMKAMAPQVDEIDLVKIVSEYRALFWSELDFTNGERFLTQPIVVSEWSRMVIGHSLFGILSKYGLSEEVRTQIGNYMIANIIPTHHANNLGQYGDVKDAPTSAQNLFASDTLELSNIPAEFANFPEELLRLLISAYYLKMHQLLSYEAEASAQAVEITHQRLLYQDYKIAISTWNKSLAQALKALGGEEKLSAVGEANFTPSGTELETGDFWMFRAYSQPLYTVSFPIRTLYKLAVANPEIEKAAEKSLRPGWHQIYHRLRQLEVL